MLLVLFSHPHLGETDGDLTDLLRSVDELIAAGAPADEAAAKSGALKHLARNDRHAPSDQLLHLAFLLERANRAPALAEPEVRQEVLDHAVVALDHIRRWQARGSAALALVEESVTPANDLCADAIPLAEGTVSGTTTGAGADGVSTCGSASSPDVWYSFTATAAAPMLFETANSSFQPVLSLHSACPDAAGDHTLSCGGPFSTTWEPQVRREMSAGETVWLRVAGSQAADSGTFDLLVDEVDSGISGTVTRLDDGSAVSGASVQVFREGSVYPWAPTHVQTAADGSYTFGPLANGDWYVLVDAPNLVDQVWQDVDCFGCSVSSDGDAITLADSVVSGIDFALPTGGAVSGRVTLEVDGTPAPAQVIAYGSAGQVVASVVAENDGTYLLGGLPTDGVYLKARGDSPLASEVWKGVDCSGTCDPTAGSPLFLTYGATATDVDFTLLRMGSIRGVVTRASDGQPLSAGVAAYRSPALGLYMETSVSTDPKDGSYVLEGLRAQTYWLVASASDQVPELYRDLPCPRGGDCPTEDATTIFPELGMEVTGVDFSLAELSTLTGRVTDDESGLPLTVWVLLWPADNSGLPGLIDQETVDGYYEFTDLPPVDYRIHVRDTFNDDPYAPSVYEDQAYDGIGCEPGCDSRSGDPYTLPVATTAHLDFALDRCSADSHLVLDDPLSAPAAYEACRDIVVSNAVSGSGSLTLRAGRSIRFANGFSLGSGIGLVAEIDPAVASD